MLWRSQVLKKLKGYLDTLSQCKVSYVNTIMLSGMKQSGKNTIRSGLRMSLNMGWSLG
jgi:hypothetical protein